MAIATGILSGRPDLAPAGVVALYRGRVSANEQRLTASQGAVHLHARHRSATVVRLSVLLA